VWTDSHCHVHEHSDPAGVLVRAREAGITQVVCVGTSADDSHKAVELAEASHRANARPVVSEPPIWPALAFATVGLHPHEASRGTTDVARLLAEVVDAAEDGPRVVVGVGECGLDYHYDHSPRDLQRQAFANQVVLANGYGFTLVVHTREAWEDTFAVLRSAGIPPKLVFHCFTGGPAEAERCLELGAYLSFSGIVTFKNAEEIRAAAAVCPLERMLVETDSPFLTPLPHRGRPNEPMYIPLVGEALAAAKNVPIEVIEAATSANAAAAFGLAGDESSAAA
jgi:TatD DNase family protein